MEAILSPLTKLLMLLIPLGAAPRITYCLIYIATDSDQAPTYKRRLRNALIFVAVAESIGSLVRLVSRYIGA